MGTKGDIRWWRQTDRAGRGYLLTAEAPFHASALHYDIAELDEGTQKHQRHPSDLKPATHTNLFLDLEHTGVGGVNSWGKDGIALPQYRVYYGNKVFRFRLQPTKF